MPKLHARIYFKGPDLKKKAKCLLLYIPIYHILFLYDPLTVYCPINRFPKQVFPAKFINMLLFVDQKREP